MQPARQYRMSGEVTGVMRQGGKGALRDVFRQLRVAHATEGGGINQINVPSHQLREGGVRAVLRVLLQ